MNRKNIRFLALLFVISIGIGWYTQADLPTIFNGILTSLVASLVFLIFTTLVDNSDDEIKEGVKKNDQKIAAVDKSIEAGLKNLQELENEIQDINKRLLKVNEYIDNSPNNLREKLGIIRIENRKEYSYSFWSSFLKDAVESKSKRFIISGKTLHRWLEAEIVGVFKSSLLEMISEKVKIEFVIYNKPTNPQKKEDLKKFLYTEIFPHLVCICGRDLKEINKVFSIYEVNRLPYLYTAIDSQIVVAQYFSNTSNSENIMLVLSPECSFAHRYQEDFSAIQKCQNNTWIKSYLQQMKGSQK